MKFTWPSDVSTTEVILNETDPASGRVMYLLPKIIFNETHPDSGWVMYLLLKMILNETNLDLLPDLEKTDEEPVSEFLWRGVYCRMDIKDFLPKQANLCEHTWEIVVCMVMTGEDRSGPNIWPEIPN